MKYLFNKGSYYYFNDKNDIEYIVEYIGISKQKYVFYTDEGFEIDLSIKEAEENIYELTIDILIKRIKDIEEIINNQMNIHNKLIKIRKNVFKL